MNARLALAAVALIACSLFLCGCGIGRAGALTLLTEEVAPPQAQRVGRMDVQTVMIDTYASAHATYISKEAPAELVAYYRQKLHMSGWRADRAEQSAPDNKGEYGFERLGVGLTVSLSPETDTEGKPLGTRVSTHIEIAYPWDMLCCRFVQGLVFGLLHPREDKPEFMIVGMF